MKTNTALKNRIQDRNFLAAYQNITHCKKAGISHLYADNQASYLPHIYMNGKNIVSFGVADYLGLSSHPALRAGAHKAIDDFGIQLASSRVYLSSPLYHELENRLETLFSIEPVITATVTLGHQSTIPTVIQSGDVAIFDQMVHSSVSFLQAQLIRNGVAVEVVMHNNLVALAVILEKNKEKRCWYLADGMYSMFGDFAPMPALVLMLEKYPNLYLYLDDAHGMSWTGPRGTGYVFQHIANHPRVIFCISQAKGFGAGGGVFLIADPQMRDLVKTLGQTMIFSGPIQMPVLGAAIASANLHISGEVEQLQKNLASKIALAKTKCQEYGLPLVSKGLTPIFFIGVGSTPLTMAVCKQLKDANFLVNVAAYPAVPPGRSGLRISINASHTADEITSLFACIGQFLPKALHEDNSNLAEIARHFKCTN